MSSFSTLEATLREINDLRAAAAVLSWDQTTYMPPRGGEGRGRQLATLHRLAQTRLSDPALGERLEAERARTRDDPDGYPARLVNAAIRERDRSCRVSPELWGEIHEHQARSYQAWVAARPRNDFASVKPILERTLELSRRVSDCFDGHAHVADPLIAFSDEGMTVETLRELFGELRSFLTPLVEAIARAEAPDDACLSRRYPIEDQIRFGEAVIRDFGFDFSRGRQDRSPHPFMTRFAAGDIRITTRLDEVDLAGGLFGTLHECGHALYELGIDPAYDATPLGTGVSAGVHESQSRLWENLVGRSRRFWRGRYPALQAAFPDQLARVSCDEFYAAVNRVQPGLIRTEADEVTYNLHVIVRFDLELALLEGSLAVADLPDAWRERYRRDLGITPPDDKDGVLQDVHWFSGLIGGAFQGYTIGNVLAAQFYECALGAHPSIEDEIEAGRFDTLHGWLRENVYRHGAAYRAPELVRRVTGGDMDAAPYRRYLTTKFGALYRL